MVEILCPGLRISIDHVGIGDITVEGGVADQHRGCVVAKNGRKMTL
jgi:hypothetical protein